MLRQNKPGSGLNGHGVKLKQYKANFEIQQSSVEVWIYDWFNFIYIPLQSGTKFRYNLISGWETVIPHIDHNSW